MDPATITHVELTKDPLNPRCLIGEKVPLPGSTKGEVLRYDYASQKTGRGTILTTVYEGVAHDGCVLHVISFGTSSEPGAWSAQLGNVPTKPATAKRIRAEYEAHLNAAKGLVAARLAWLRSRPDIFKAKGY